jgi:hypothetical protein
MALLFGMFHCIVELYKSLINHAPRPCPGIVLDFHVSWIKNIPTCIWNWLSTFATAHMSDMGQFAPSVDK